MMLDQTTLDETMLDKPTSYRLKPGKNLPCLQGDQIGRMVAYWTIVYFSQLLLNYSSSPNVRAIFFNGKSSVLLLTKKWIELQFGRFFHKRIRSHCRAAWRNGHHIRLRNRRPGLESRQGIRF
jgi:hypothetical protein